MSNPRIHIIVPTFFPLVGGTERQALAHGRSLQERGFVATIITLRHDRHWLPHEVIEGVPTIRVAGRLLGRREKLPQALRRLLYLLALLVMSWTLWSHRRRYDILHLYHLGSEALPVTLVCHLTGKPLIISVRGAGTGGNIESGDKELLAAPSPAAAASWEQFNQHYKHAGDLEALERFGKPAAQLVRYLLRRIQAVIVILSSRMKDYLTTHDFNLPAVQLIPNGVDITRYRPIRAVTSNPASFSWLDQQTPMVVCVSRLRYEKGIDVLLQAWYLVHKRCPQARLIIVGNGPLQDQLEHMAQALEIADSIEFAGLQSDVAAQFHRGDLAVLPSLCEGMSNALLEAMACGLPCVATRVSGSEDVIQDRVNGLLVEPADFHGLAEALTILLLDPDLARTYGRAARATVEKHYSHEHITDVYVELYQSLAGGRSYIPA